MPHTQGTDKIRRKQVGKNYLKSVYLIWGLWRLCPGLCSLHANEVKKTQVHLLSNAFAFQVKRKYVSGKTSKRFHTNVKAFFAPDELP